MDIFNSQAILDAFAGGIVQAVGFSAGIVILIFAIGRFRRARAERDDSKI